MDNLSKHSQLILSLIVIVILVNPVILSTQQTPPRSLDRSKGQTEGLELQDIFNPSYIIYSPINITSNADFEAQAFPGNGTETNPYEIKGYSITTTETCISIKNTDVYFVIRDCLLTGGGISVGIHLQYVTHGEIRNNTISEKYAGIAIYTSPETIILNNTISENSEYGLLLNLSPDNLVSANIFVNNTVHLFGYPEEYTRQNITADNTVNGKLLGYFWNWTGGTVSGTQYSQVILANCSGVTVENCVFSNTPLGISLFYSSYCTLNNNTISENSDDGMYLWFSSKNTFVNNTISGNSGKGVFFRDSSNNTMVNNTISEIGHIGVHFALSYNNTLTNNTFSGITSRSIVMDLASYNTVVSNIILGNFQGVMCYSGSENNLFYLNVLDHAYDDGIGNHWNTTGMGNYWLHYTGSGVYNIPGDAGSIDYHPFIIAEYISPTIDNPVDRDYEEGTTGHSIVWTPGDAHPSHYVIYRNGTEVTSGSWNESIITVNVDGLDVGVYNYTIVVYDVTGNWISDSVIVTVLPQSTTTTTTTFSTTTTTSTTSTATTPTPSVDLSSLIVVVLVVSVIGVVLVVLMLVRFRRGSMS